MGDDERTAADRLVEDLSEAYANLTPEDAVIVRMVLPSEVDPNDPELIEAVARAMWLLHFSEGPDREGPFRDRPAYLRKGWLADAWAAVVAVRAYYESEGAHEEA